VLHQAGAGAVELRERSEEALPGRAFFESLLRDVSRELLDAGEPSTSRRARGERTEARLAGRAPQYPKDSSSLRPQAEPERPLLVHSEQRIAAREIHEIADVVPGYIRGRLGRFDGRSVFLGFFRPIQLLDVKPSSESP
jgi:hypothetical protein